MANLSTLMIEGRKRKKKDAGGEIKGGTAFITLHRTGKK